MIKEKKVAFYTLGCKLNFSETSTIARDFQSKGFERVEFNEKADIYVINTCSVTDNADKRFKTIVKSALRLNENAFLIAIGCYAQLKPEELANIDGVDLVLGATEKFKVTDYINDLSKNDIGEVHSCEIDEADFYVGSYSIGDRTRAFLKVQDGCDYSLKNVLYNAREISNKGIKEIVLTGVNIGDYGKGEFGNKNHEHTFLDMVQNLDKIVGIERLRISSIEPNLLKNETIDFVAKSRCFVPHFHIPLQSGNNELLKSMKRRYRKEIYADRVTRIKNIMPDACIGVDVIVGFPGETDEMFLETYNFLNDLNISYLHVFTYSERPNTEAVLMANIVPQKVRNKRSKMLRGLSVKKRRYFYENQIGNELSVLFEGENKNGSIHGFTENYVKVKTKWNPELINTIHSIKLTEIDEDGLVKFNWIKKSILA
jgi:threonylcarbamoyladenosine tRNA methylthiotransferase MtaB